MQCEKIREIENDVFNDDNEFDLGQPGETGETVVWSLVSLSIFRIEKRSQLHPYLNMCVCAFLQSPR